MAPRIPRLPKATPTELFFIAAAGVGVLAPLYMVVPGADEKLANQTNKWAPRWEKNINYFSSPVERGVQRIEPPVSKFVQHVDSKLPLEKIAKGTERRIKGGIAKFGPKDGSASS